MASFTAVERAFLAKSGRDAHYDGERIPVIEVQNVYELGQLVAVAFLEWVQANPAGVVALPTGRTPEYFIKTLDRFRTHWSEPALVAELTALGFSPGPAFPTTSGLSFVMLDEFFPMPAAHRNAFCNYVSTYYTQPMGIPADRVLHFDLAAQGVLSPAELAETFKGADVDLSLLQRAAQGPVEERRKDVLGRVQVCL